MSSANRRWDPGYKTCTSERSPDIRKRAFGEYPRNYECQKRLTFNLQVNGLTCLYMSGSMVHSKLKFSYIFLDFRSKKNCN